MFGYSRVTHFKASCAKCEASDTVRTNSSPGDFVSIFAEVVWAKTPVVEIVRKESNRATAAHFTGMVYLEVEFRERLTVIHDKEMSKAGTSTGVLLA